MASTLIDVTRDTSTLQAFELMAPEDMLTGLEHVAGLPSNAYSGSITVANNAGALVWQLLINNQTANASAFAGLGDWLIIENGATVSVCPDADFDAMYTPS